MSTDTKATNAQTFEEFWNDPETIKVRRQAEVKARTLAKQTAETQRITKA